MLAKRIIPCLDVKEGMVVKGVQFREHQVIGDAVELACRYRDEGADELVFYDITASADGRTVERKWVERVARVIDIPFCVAGGIRSVAAAQVVLQNGADKISINSPALERPDLINELAETFGTQCVVVGIDSRTEGDDYVVYQYTGDETKTIKTKRGTLDWARTVEARGAGEIVLNCMNQDGMRQGYDIVQLQKVRASVTIPLVASGGAGAPEHFGDVFHEANVDAALAASVFHKDIIAIGDLKRFLHSRDITVRL